MVLSRPPWPMFLIDWECKQLRDTGGHPEYIIIFQQSADGCLKTFG